jgi:hypothetical protein
VAAKEAGGEGLVLGGLEGAGGGASRLFSGVLLTVAEGWGLAKATALTGEKPVS